MIDKAIIPIAGLGTRLRPLSRAVPKALFPLMCQGRLRPVVHFICAEALAGGAREVALVVSPGQEEACKAYFAAAAAAGDADLPEAIHYIPAEPRGLGYAVAQGRDFVGGRPFMVLLGDHVHQADAGQAPCGGQVAAAFASHGGAAMIGMQLVDEHALPRVGAAAGLPMGDDLYRCTRFIEKPSPQAARAALRTPGLPEGRYLAHCGIYVFTAEIFDCLAEVGAGLPDGRELQLADAQSLLLRRHPQDYYLLRVRGHAMDTGTPQVYADAWRTLLGGQDPAELPHC